MTTNDYFERVTAAFKALPYGARVHWRSPVIDPEDHTATGFVDIDVPAVTNALGTGWICTVVAPTDPDAGSNDPFTLVVEPDSDGTWTVDMLTRALADWIRRQVGRADLTFSYERT